MESSLSQLQREELLSLVPDAFDCPDERWRIVPHTKPGFVYSVSSKRDLLVKHSTQDKLGRKYKPQLVVMQKDVCVYNTGIRRESNQYSTYIHLVRYDTFPELNPLNHRNAEDVFVDSEYAGLEWLGRRKTVIHYIPVSDIDMNEVRQFYPDDLPREVWGYVPGSSHKYVISTQGRGVILSSKRSNGQYLPPRKWQLESGSGGRYYECCYSVDNHQLNSVSHPHILRSFIPRPSDKHEVNHIDGDTHHNILDNLEWVTRQENADHYNKSPEMAHKRAAGYKKISEYGKTPQKEIQNRPEVNRKRSATLKARRKTQIQIVSIDEG